MQRQQRRRGRMTLEFTVTSKHIGATGNSGSYCIYSTTPEEAQHEQPRKCIQRLQ